MKRFGNIAVVLAGGLACNAGFCAPNPAAIHTPPPALAFTRTAPAKDAEPNSAPANNPPPDIGSSDNPYVAIASRNIFGLNPPAPATNVPNPEDNLPKITPTGIMGVFGSYQVLFKVALAKPTPADKDQFYILSEGQRQDDIEVVKIDYEKGLVTFDNHGTTQELPLAEASGSGGASSAPQGGMNPAMSPAAFGGRGRGGSGGFTTFGAAPATPNSNPATTWSNPNGQPGNPANGGLDFNTPVQPGRIYQPEASNLTPEQSQLLLVAQHLKAQQEGNPTAPLFPPSAIDKEAGINSNTGGNNTSSPP